MKILITYWLIQSTIKSNHRIGVLGVGAPKLKVGALDR